ncbi:MAG TPA: hypothetical protein VJ717_12945 [Gemmatimonadaceae bacterium]|nr:hypothetical protein [Gemmatimonadaceae bacterium]
MYATCLFCNKPLGSNEALETFPVGRRLAFDAERGRLWVVCRQCERWNLSPLDERWEAIEQAEKLYRDTRRRVATDNIGLAHLRDGTTLVRIGKPQRPEFAAWRYGDQFGRRRKRQLLYAGGGIAAIGALATGGAIAGVGIGAFGWVIANMGQAIVRGNPEDVVAKIRTDKAGLVHVRRRHLGESSIARADDGSMSLFLRFKNGSETFQGHEAERIASIVLPKVNRFGGGRKAVSEAVSEIEQSGSTEAYLDRLTRTAREYARPYPSKKRSRWTGHYDFNKYGLYSLPGPHRLALEMALHEEAERRALEGELVELEKAWKDAEEIAAIADNLLLPESVEAAFDAMKRRSGS